MYEHMHYFKHSGVLYEELIRLLPVLDDSTISLLMHCCFEARRSEDCAVLVHAALQHILTHT